MKRLMSLLLGVVLIILALPAIAQDTTVIPLTGTIDSIDGTTIVLDGVTVDISNVDATIITNLEVGTVITITGNLSGTVFIAVTIDDDDDDDDTPEATEAPDPTPEPEETDDVSIDIYISIDNGTTWVSDDDVEVDTDDDGVLVRFVVTNNGDTPMTTISISETNLDISTCDIPEELPAGENFDCTTIVLFVDADAIENFGVVIVIVGQIDGIIISTSGTTLIRESADDGNGGTIIIIEGAVEKIEANIITIFNFNIALDESDPILTVIQIGDIIHIEGELDDDSPLIIAIFIIFVNVDVYVFDGIVWRDPGTCNAPPPPWAPAHGWRARCIVINTGGGGSGSGSGRGRRGSGSKKGSKKS